MFELTSEQWKALSPFLDQALEMGDEERTTWLTSMRASNPELAQQLETLIQEHRALSDEGFLEARPAAFPAPRGLAGQSFGAYTLKSQIGQGGMGTVWLAERNDGRFDRRVAVKTLNVALMGNNGEARFRLEGSILARLAHPHIAELFDAGVSPGGQPYLVLEYVDGEPIHHYCDRRGLDVEARIRLLLDVLDAVAHAHAHSIVHRDIKPSNVLVSNEGQVKLLDFGIAKLLEEEGRAEPLTRLTREGALAMTPEYAAPEQVTGGPITNATDVYGLGVLAYVLLTGQHPAGRALHSPADLVKAVVDTDPPRLSTATAANSDERETAAANAARRGSTPGKLSQLLRGDLDTIVAKSLKKNPQERYASVQDFADDLRRYLRLEPIRARPDSMIYRAGKFMRRHRRAAIPALLGLVALTAAVVVTGLLSNRSDDLPEFRQRRLTANDDESPVLNAALSPDGKYLAYSDLHGVHVEQIETGRIQDVALSAGTGPPMDRWSVGSWFADSQHFLVSAAAAGAPVSLLSVPIAGGDVREIAKVDDMAGAAKISPDGSRIGYARLRSSIGAHEIWIMGSHGESPHKIVTAENQSTFQGFAWSPTGRRIVYSYSQLRSHVSATVQSCDLNGENQTSILSNTRVNAMIWLSPDRFIFSRNAERGAAESDNLWELKVDDKTGIAHGKPRRLTDWSGFSVQNFSVTADGKNLAFLRSTEHGTILVGDLNGKGSVLANTRRLVLDDNLNIPLAWTPDSRSVIFSAQITAERLIYRQALDAGSTPQVVTPGSGMNFYLARFSPDRAWMLLEGDSSASQKMGIYRMPVAGGVPQLLFPVEAFVWYSCTNRGPNFCVIEQPSGDNELVVSSFDPQGTNRKELLRIPLPPGSSARVGFDYIWQVSPDGAWMGLARMHGNSIRLFSLKGGAARDVTLQGYSDLVDLNWATDSQRMFVSTLAGDGAKLVNVDLNGDARPIWQQSQARWTRAFQSPDGRHLAISVSGLQANAWMIRNF